VVVRDFRTGDQEALRRLILGGLRERWGDAFDPALNPDLDDFVANYVDRGAEVIVVECDGGLVATGTLIPEPPAAGRIVRMSVSASHRRQGLGRRVVNELIGRARRRGMAELRVLTDTPWASAVALYRACGFTHLCDDGIDTHFVMNLSRSETDPRARNLKRRTLGAVPIEPS
jgi:GNAT superfamily N-acetyltransferase